MNHRRSIVRAVRRRTWKALDRLAGGTCGGECAVCGERHFVFQQPVLWAGLIDAWELDREWVRAFDQREGEYCIGCHASLRMREHARVIVSTMNRRLGSAERSLSSLAGSPAFHAVRVAEINSCGTLHSYLAKHPELAYSEYGGRDPSIRDEDLMRLSYPDATFDLVLTSETLEHVPDPIASLREIERVLRCGGQHVFTIPVVWNRPSTRTRARIVGGQIQHLLPPSHHGGPQYDASDFLVFTEFGADVLRMIDELKFRTRMVNHPTNPAVVTLVSEKTK